MRIKDVERKEMEKRCTKRGAQQKTEKLKKTNKYKNRPVSRRNEFCLIAFLL